jgi:hypothetical protein
MSAPKNANEYHTEEEPKDNNNLDYKKDDPLSLLTGVIRAKMPDH